MPGFAGPIPDVTGRGAAGAIGGIAVVAAGCGTTAEGTPGAIGEALMGIGLEIPEIKLSVGAPA